MTLLTLHTSFLESIVPLRTAVIAALRFRMCQERWAGGLEEYSKGFLSIYIGSIDIDSKRKELRALCAPRMRYATSHVCLGIRDIRLTFTYTLYRMALLRSN